MAGHRTEIITAGDRRMMLDLWGESGPTVVALHGIPGWRGTWTRVAELLAPDHRVMAPDLLGFGASDPGPPGAHAREQAAALAQALDALGVASANVAGFDFGGPVAVHLAALRPTLARSLVLTATNLFPDTPVPLPLRIARVPLLGEAFFRLAFSEAGLVAMWRAACGDRRAFPLERYREALAVPGGVASTRRIFLASLRDLARLYAPVARAAQALRVPTIVLWGDRDPFFPVSVGDRTARAVRGELRVLRGCGHFVPEERPSDVAAAIRALSAGEGTT